ncbi:hypothetical protein OESDEN_02929 [Oesophagostomum dentatum]|uniref:Uncharacterized protein n=1 Tax=Oesophagostomum dentatum TaxID=61180 RepID=A0A0B1TIM6_OESDE|nr:hypothetical protein OESDEN_02929 [Oesophagostomum dentatum]
MAEDAEMNCQVVIRFLRAGEECTKLPDPENPGVDIVVVSVRIKTFHKFIQNEALPELKMQFQTAPQGPELIELSRRFPMVVAEDDETQIKITLLMDTMYREFYF